MTATSVQLRPRPQRTVLVSRFRWESEERGGAPQAPGRVLWLIPWEDGDLSGPGQLLDDLGLVVGVVDAGLPELSGVAVLLPVVVPVPTAVGPEAKDVDLKDSTANQKAAGGVVGVAGQRLTWSHTCRAKNSTSMPVDG